MSMFSKKDSEPVTLKVSLKHGNTLSEIFNNYEKAMKKLAKLEWNSFDLTYEDNIKRPEEIEKLSDYVGFDFIKRYSDSEWEMTMVISEMYKSEIKFRC